MYSALYIFNMIYLSSLITEHLLGMIAEGKK